MNLKLNTKESFHVITMLNTTASANMAEEFKDAVENCLNSNNKNIIVDMSPIDTMDADFANFLIVQQEAALEDNRSLVFFNIQKNLTHWLDENDLLDSLNVTPTESEAWDIIHMEEMEREMFGDEDLADN